MSTFAMANNRYRKDRTGINKRIRVERPTSTEISSPPTKFLNYSPQPTHNSFTGADEPLQPSKRHKVELQVTQASARSASHAAVNAEGPVENIQALEKEHESESEDLNEDVSITYIKLDPPDQHGLLTSSQSLLRNKLTKHTERFAKENQVAVIDLDGNNSDDSSSVRNSNETEPNVGSNSQKDDIYIESDVDNFMYCVDCRRTWEGDCPRHGPLIIIEDIPIPPRDDYSIRALMTAPPQVTIRKFSERERAVFAQEALPSRLRFGPLEGKIIAPLHDLIPSIWLVRKHGKLFQGIDVSNCGLSNWMRYVRCAKDEAEKNCDCFQYKGQLYFKTIRAIRRKEELLVGYYDYRGMVLKFEPEFFRNAIQRSSKGFGGATQAIGANSSLREKPFECQVCDRRFSRQSSLKAHMRKH